jgi:DNA-binding MarR family transcriptional regulator
MLILITRIFSEKGSACLRHYDLTPTQFYILSEVQNENHISQQKIADQLGVTKGSISQTVKILEKKGLIVRLKVKHSQYMELTEKSKIILDVVIPEHEKIAENLFSSLPGEEFEQMKTSLNHLYQSLASQEGRASDSMK